MHEKVRQNLVTEISTAHFWTETEIHISNRAIR